MPRGLYKATAGARKRAEVQPGEKCTLHPDREATHTICSAWGVVKPACDECAEYGAQHGSTVWPPIQHA